jgi:nicotinate-nucleotide adenylyltransferase
MSGSGKPMKTGVLGGTFDPVHNGHMMIAGEAMKRLELDEVLFVPTSQTPLKEDNAVTPVEHCVRMVELAIAGSPAFRLSEIEIDRAGVSYTVDTIAALKKETGDAAELYFIIGLDSLVTLPRWKDPDRLVVMCRLVAVRRPGYDMPDIENIEKLVPGLAESLILIDKPELDISATDIRKRVAEGLPVDGLVPAAVGKYIRENSLYIIK